MFHVVFDHPYTRTIAVVVLSVILTFIDKIEAFHSVMMFYVISAITALMIFSASLSTPFTTPYVDYGFILLLMSILVMTYNNIKNRHRV